MGVLHRIKPTVVMTKHWPGIDAFVYSEKGHTHVLPVSSGQCPKAAMSVAIVGANAWVYYVCPAARNIVYSFLE
jgi:hypothetical protein